MSNVVHLYRAHGAMRPRNYIHTSKLRPRRCLPTLTPTTRWGRLVAWVRGALGSRT